jgi:NAD(P)-dependent dehydrogenase (short-subunit alcohol dehydrogenase family)
MPEPRTVLVTGANSGIGLATVIELARRGHRVVGSVRSQRKADQVRERAEGAGVRVETVLLDVDDDDRCREVVDELKPWALVNNAGFAKSGAVEEVADDEARRQLETLVVAPMRLARLALPWMRDQNGGRIVNVSSISAEVTMPLMGWYQAAKAALEGVTDALRTEVRRDGIHVTLVEPGMIDTPIWDDARHELDDPTAYGSAYEAWARATSRLRPLMASPEAVARAIAGVLESDRPRARYKVGVDAHLLVHGTRWLPTRVTDRLSRSILRLR